jgi:hypothetical protein
VNKLAIICEDPECPCEDKCCQSCEAICDNPCDAYKYQENIYSDANFLIKELNDLAGKKDLWIIAVAAQAIQTLHARIEELEGTLEKIADAEFIWEAIEIAKQAQKGE